LNFPRTEEETQPESTWQKLARLNPQYLSVTFAGGSTLDAT
jgi:hypothetical protein